MGEERATLTRDRLPEFAPEEATRQAVDVEIRAEMDVHQGAKHAKDEDKISVFEREVRFLNDDAFQNNQINRHRNSGDEKGDHTRGHHQRHLPFDHFALGDRRGAISWHFESFRRRLSRRTRLKNSRLRRAPCCGIFNAMALPPEEIDYINVADDHYT